MDNKKEIRSIRVTPRENAKKTSEQRRPVQRPEQLSHSQNIHSVAHQPRVNVQNPDSKITPVSKPNSNQVQRERVSLPRPSQNQTLRPPQNRVQLSHPIQKEKMQPRLSNQPLPQSNQRERALVVQRPRPHSIAVPQIKNEPTIRVRGPVDRVMLITIIVLLVLGIVTVFSASYPYANEKYGNSLYFMEKQLGFAALGFAAMLIISFVPYQAFRRGSILAYGIALILLVLVLFFGISQGVAKRWLAIPGIGISFQPSEVMKVALILILAAYYGKFKKDYLNRENPLKQRLVTGYMFPALIIGLALGLVLLEKHLSGMLILALLGFIMMFASGVQKRYLAVLIGICVLAALVYLLSNAYAMSRVTNFISGQTSTEMTDERRQTLHGLWAIGSGGFAGIGLGGSRLKYLWVSQAHNDFIFTIWCEETGFVGAVFLIALYGFFAWRGVCIARRAPDTFSSLTAFGITAHIILQVIMNIAVVTDLIPNTGITLPFFSYGGTSLLIMLAECGILLSISRYRLEVVKKEGEKP